MYYEIDAQTRELDAVLDEFRETLHRINNFNAEDRRYRLRLCSQYEQQVKTIRAAYVLEMKAMDDPEVKKKYHVGLKERIRIFKNLVAELEMKKNEIDREQLTVGMCCRN